MSLPAVAGSQIAPWHDSPFLRACRREPTDFTPIWLMRQAGRYMPEYRRIREQHSFLELCRNPQLCSEIMCTAVEQLGVDAAIVFSDLLPILEPMGMDLEFAHGEGPLIHNPVRESADVDRVVELGKCRCAALRHGGRATNAGRPAGRTFRSSDLPVRRLRSPATRSKAAPAASYLHTKTLMYRDAGRMERTDGPAGARGDRVSQRSNRRRRRRPCSCSTVGSAALGQTIIANLCCHLCGQIIDGIAPGVPVISFATGNPQLIRLLAEAAPRSIGVDWRVRLEDAWQMVGHDRAIQGNFDPTVLLADRDEIRRRATGILEQAAGRPGHIFNLGHGVLPQTPVDNARALVDIVHEFQKK